MAKKNILFCPLVSQPLTRFLTNTDVHGHSDPPRPVPPFNLTQQHNAAVSSALAVASVSVSWGPEPWWAPQLRPYGAAMTLLQVGTNHNKKGSSDGDRGQEGAITGNVGATLWCNGVKCPELRCKQSLSVHDKLLGAARMEFLILQYATFRPGRQPRQERLLHQGRAPCMV